MKKIKYILFCFLVISCQGHQTVKKIKTIEKTPLTYSKIDSLNSEAGVQKFVRANDTNYKKFELRKIADFHRVYRSSDQDSLIKILSKRLKVDKSFYKADIDNNGFTDLVVIGDNYTCSTSDDNGKEVSCDFSVFALMNFGKDSVKYERLLKGYNATAVPKISKVNGVSKVAIVNLEPIYSKEMLVGTKDKTDLLEYKFGSFIDYQEDEEVHSIEKIEFSASACFGQCPIFKLEISKGRKAILWAEEYNYSKTFPKNAKEFKERTELKGKYKSTLTEEKYQEIIELINYLNLEKLENSYSINATDNPGSLLKITYDNGKTKIIDDYGINGTRGLRRLYTMLFDLRFNQQWHLMSKKLDIQLY